MERCKTCKHWSRHEVGIEPRWGKCGLIREAFDSTRLDGVLARVATCSQSTWPLVVHQEFGCVHWERREEGK